MKTVTHTIRNPGGFKWIVSMALISGLSMWNLLGRSALHDGIPSVLSFAVLLFSLMVLFCSVYRVLKKPTELRMDEGTLSLNGRSLQAEDIQVIMKMGYIGPLVGLKPYGKRVVPVPLCFRFARNEEQGLDDLLQWAKAHEVTVTEKFFFRWL